MVSTANAKVKVRSVSGRRENSISFVCELESSTCTYELQDHSTANTETGGKVGNERVLFGPCYSLGETLIDGPSLAPLEKFNLVSRGSGSQ